MPERDPRDPRTGARDPRDERRLIDPTDPRDPRVIPVDPRDARRGDDPRDKRTHYDEMSPGVVPWSSYVLAAGYFLIGGGLVVQSSRFSNTPAYANLLNIIPAQAWGLLYLAAAFLMVLAALFAGIRLLVVIASTFSIALTSVWWLAFIVRYATDNGTTIVNVVSWSVFLALLIQSATVLVVRRVGD